jgi:hypothetical protein
MHKHYNPHNLEANFKSYLETNDYSRTSIFSYIGDIRKFLSWYSLMLTKQDLSFDLNYLTQQTLDRYKSHLQIHKVPVKTINRSLSSLRTFAKFCVVQGYVATNPFMDVPNLKAGKSTLFTRGFALNGKSLFFTLFGYALVIGLFLSPALFSYTSRVLKNKDSHIGSDEISKTLGALDFHEASTSADLLTIPITDEKGSLNLTAPYPKIIGHTGTLSVEAPQVKLRTYGGGPIVLNTDEGPIQFLFEGRKPPLPYETAFYFAANDIRIGSVLHAQTEDSTGTVDILNLSSGLPAVSRFRVDSEGNVHIKGNIILDGNLIMSPDAVIFGQVATGTATSSASPEPIPAQQN